MRNRLWNLKLVPAPLSLTALQPYALLLLPTNPRNSTRNRSLYRPYHHVQCIT